MLVDHDGMRDRQALTGAMPLGMGREEGQENPLAVRFRDTDAVVCNRNPHVGRRVPRLDRDQTPLAPCVQGWRNGVSGID